MKTNLVSIVKRAIAVAAAATAITTAASAVLAQPAAATLSTPLKMSSLAVARNGNGTLELFGTTSAPQMYNRWQTGPNANFTGWNSFAGNGETKVAAATNSDGRLEAFAVRGTTLVHRWQEPAKGAGWWSDWAPLDNGGTAKVAAARNSDGVLHAFTVSTSGQIYQRSQQQSAANGWSGSKRLWTTTGFRNIAVGVRRNGGLAVFAVDANQQLKLAHQNGYNGPWVGKNLPSTTMQVANVAVTSNNEGRMEMFFTTPKGELYHQWFDANDNPTSPRLLSTNISPISLAAGTNHDGRVEVFANDRNGYPQHMWQQTPLSPSWTGWVRLN